MMLLRVSSAILLMFLAACASPEPAVVQRSSGPYIAATPESFDGHVIGTGYCVAFVQAAAGVPRTTQWQEGARVRGNPDIARGTAIATFEPDGSYTSESGNHAAIYLSQDDRGIWVYDQWQGQPVHSRLIRFEDGSGAKWGNKSNDGKRFAVIE
ncbi:MAG: BPSL0067 family protein [Pseudomonadota bacterium]